ncbi:MAG TPA: efflux RND transporter periplasmic adaptor subunit [candidate division Zixibacteria bacterium]|jgi:HlyD family secretion protein
MIRTSQAQTAILAAISLLATFTPGCEKPVEEPVYRQVTVTVRDIVVSANAAGVVEPIKVVEVKSKASGEIIGVFVEEGDEVRAGEMLVRVDPRFPRNAVTQAEADSVVAVAELENAESRLRRAEELFAAQSITEQEYDDARLAQAAAYAVLVRAQSALEDAKIAYEETEVRAPSAGTILSKNVELGTVITSASRDISGGSVLMRMANLDTVQVRALVNERDIGKARPGMPVTIQVEAYSNRTFRGDVLRIGAEAIIDQNVTMFPAIIRIANESNLLRPGMNAEVDILIGSIHDALTIPNAALRTPDDLKTIAPLVGLTAEIVEEQLGTESGGRARHDEGSRPQGGDGGRSPEQHGEDGGGERADSDHSSHFGGTYAVLTLRNGQAQGVTVHTGLTDFLHVAVLDGLSVEDTILILPTAGLIESQQSWQDRARQRAGGPLSTGNR